MSRVMRKSDFCICKNKDADQRLCIRYIRIVQSLYFLILRFQASSHLLCLKSPVQSLYFLILRFQASSHPLCLKSPVCGREPKRQVLSCHISNNVLVLSSIDVMVVCELYSLVNNDFMSKLIICLTTLILDIGG